LKETKSNGIMDFNIRKKEIGKVKAKEKYHPEIKRQNTKQQARARHPPMEV
jgi:hypothetical protein